MSIIDSIKTGEKARLMPVLPDSKREEKATSILLAAFRVIPDFAKTVLEEAGAAVGTRAKIDCYTEVVFNKESLKASRPDGLIVINTGRSEWSALVESKIGSSALTNQQVVQYVDAAKELGIDAVITISNDFALLPTHHPVSVGKQALKKVSLYHFSWLSLISKAVLLSENRGVEDPEQAFILAEVIRYLEAPNSGVSALTKMDRGWKEVCDIVQQGVPLHAAQKDVESAVASWHQLLRFLSLKLSMATSSAVSLAMSRRLQGSPEEKLKENIDALVKHNALSASFEIPNAAGSLNFTADFLRRTLCFSMRLQAPQDIKRPTAGVNWITRQLKHVKQADGVGIKVHWPKRTPMTVATLASAIEAPEKLVPVGCSDTPKEIEVAVVVDLAARFKGAKTFIEESERELKRFYRDVGQHLVRWQPKAPKIKTARKSSEVEDESGVLFGESVDVIGCREYEPIVEPERKLVWPVLIEHQPSSIVES